MFMISAIGKTRHTSILRLPHQCLGLLREETRLFRRTYLPLRDKSYPTSKKWNCDVSKAMGIILGSLSQGMHQHILSLGYRTPWEMIKGIDKFILKSNRSQDYSNITYLLSSKMGANKNVTDYVARLLPIFDRLELSLRNSKGRFPKKCKSIFTLIGLTPSFESTVDLLTMVETDISFPNLVDMLKRKEQSMESTKIAKQFQGTPLIAGANVHTTRETFKSGKNYSKGR